MSHFYRLKTVNHPDGGKTGIVGIRSYCPSVEKRSRPIGRARVMRNSTRSALAALQNAAGAFDATRLRTQLRRTPHQSLSFHSICCESLLTDVWGSIMRRTDEMLEC